MITILKLAGVSALLSAGLVTGYPAHELQPAPISSGKVFYDRVTDVGPVAAATPASAARHLARVDVNSAGKSDRLHTRHEIRCTDGAFVLAPAHCVPNVDASSTPTTEIRISATLSSLVRDAGPRALASR